MTRDSFISLLVVIILGFVIYGGSMQKRSATNTANKPTSMLGWLDQEQQKTFNQYPQDQNSTISEQIRETTIQANKLRTDIEQYKSDLNASPYKGQIFITGYTPSHNDSDNEYVTLRASQQNTKPVSITGWKLVSTLHKTTATIGTAAPIFYMGTSATADAVKLIRGDEAIITTGHSPINISFHVNECAGYLTQSYNFTPEIWENCPSAYDEEHFFASLPQDQKCIDYIERIPTCKGPQEIMDYTYTKECKEYVNKHINYNGCVLIHQYDSDFYAHQWRIYLENSRTLWDDENETFQLLDNDGKIVDEQSYSFHTY